MDLDLLTCPDADMQKKCQMIGVWFLQTLLNQKDIFTLLKNKTDTYNYEKILSIYCNKYDINDIPYGKFSLLYNACINENIEQVNILIKHDADVNSIFNKNSFIYQCYNEELLKLLFDKLNNDLLVEQYFIEKHNYTAIELLLKYKNISFSKTRKIINENTLLHLITNRTESNNMCKIVKLILQKNEDWNVKNNIGITPIFNCVIYNNFKIFKLLIHTENIDYSYIPKCIKKNIISFIIHRKRNLFLQEIINYEKNKMIKLLLN